MVAVFGAALMLVPSIATAQPRPNSSADDQRSGPDRGRGDTQGRGDNDRGNAYGKWDSRWGARPAAPPRHWSKRADWYRHVRGCQQRFNSYNPRTDTYSLRRGVTRRCTL